MGNDRPPHPGAHERASVLLPWHDVDPDAVLPGHGPITALLARLDMSAMHRIPAELTLPARESACDGGVHRDRPRNAAAPDGAARRSAPAGPASGGAR